MLALRKLTMSYGQGNALNGINLEIPAGGMTALIGDNGCGKTTLMKVLAGLIQPYRGEVEIDGERDTWTAKGQVCFYPAFPFFRGGWTAGKVMRLYASLYPGYRPDRARGLLVRFGLEEDRPLGELSKGRCALTLLALFLGREGSLYLLDEPFGGIDLRTREQVKEALRECAVPDRTFLISTHEITDMEDLFDRVIWLDGGEVVLAGSLADLREQYGCSLAELVRRDRHAARRIIV